MRARLAWLLGAVGLAGLIAYLRRSRTPAAATTGTHAEELRRTLEDSRAIVEREDEPAAAEPEPPAGDLDARRRDVHDRGRSALEEMGA